MFTARYELCPELKRITVRPLKGLTSVVSARLGLRRVQRKNTKMNFLGFPIKNYCLTPRDQLLSITVMKRTARWPLFVIPAIRNDISRTKLHKASVTTSSRM